MKVSTKQDGGSGSDRRRIGAVCRMRQKGMSKRDSVRCKRNHNSDDQEGIYQEGIEKKEREKKKKNTRWRECELVFFSLISFQVP